MRNGVKNYYSHKQCSKITILLILLVITIIFIINFNIIKTKLKKDTIVLDISSRDIMINYTTIEYTKVIANLYVEKAPQSTNNYTGSQCAIKFSNARAMVIGDSTAEGLEAYGILNSSNVIWTRGRVIQYMDADLQKAIDYQPDVLFLSYGANDLLSWNGNVDGYINAYRKAIKNLNTVLPNTRICINAILPVSDKALANNPEYAYEEEFNTELEKLCIEKNITFIDNRKLLEQSKDGKKFESDGVHPKPFYYRLWANNMIESANL